ncbi:MAG: PAS domain-containing protein [Anaerolineae bacterium]|nr:PAS domain-containing protein [Anaerolineae bacterium]
MPLTIMDEYLHIFGRTGDSAVVIDSQQKVVYWNAAAEKVMGYTAREVVGHSCWQVFRGRTESGEPYCRPNCPVIEKIKSGGTIRHFNLVVQSNLGEDVVIDISTLNISQGQAHPHPILVQLSHEVETGQLGNGKLKIHLLGTTAVTRPEGTKVEGSLWNRVKVRALLAHLALQHERPVSRDYLLELLWPELDYNAALRNLNTTVYNLRKSLEPNLNRVAQSNYIMYEGNNYLLNGHVEHWLDVDVFQETIRHARHTTSQQTAINSYEEALKLYRGDYLADLQTTAVWSAAEHIRLQELCLASMEELGSLYEAVGEDTKAKDLYLKALSIDCVRETTVQKLMKLAMRHGDYGTAQAHCNRLVDSLEKELNTIPSPVTRALCQQAQCT